MIKEISNKTTARIAGLLYLMMILTGFFSLMYVPNKLIVWDNASLTFSNITASEFLFRLGIMIGLACYTFYLFLSLFLYKLLKPVNEKYAKLMVLFVFLCIPIFFVNVQNEFTVLSLVTDPNSRAIFSNSQIQSQVLLYLVQYDNGMSVVHIFSGVWLFPLGYLVFKSGFLPKFLGIFLILGCFGYLLDFTGNTLFKNYSEFGISKFIILPATIGEIGICLWMLIIGVNEKSIKVKKNGIG